MKGSFLMAGGGTGGHVIPALAVARELRKRGRQVLFVGTDRGMEAKLVPSEGFEFRRIQIGGLNRVSLGRKISTLAQLPVVTFECAGIVRRSSAVFSMGGYVAGPPVLAALATGVPLVVMEPNAVPGFTNRMIGRFVSRALLSFQETARYFPANRVEITGLPVREEFFRIPAKPRTDVFQLLITGGSQGSRALNRTAREAWPLLRASGLPIRIVHQTGPTDFDGISEAFAQSGIEGEVVRFITDMPAAFAASDLVLCRSGAGAVSELAAAGKPSILVPFPYAADDHQTRNAEALQSGGAARMIPERDLTAQALATIILDLARDEQSLTQMSASARHFAKPGAAARAADILEEVER